MNPSSPQENKDFHISVKSISQQKARAEAHGQTLELAIKGGDPTLGFTAPETLLAAFGACILSNLNKNAAEMGLHIEGAQVEFSGTKRINPLGIEPLSYRLIIYSAEPEASLRELFQKATTDGTATNMLLRGIKPESYLEIHTGLKE